MSVYVDSLRTTARTANWPYTAACHLLADTVEELHAFATLLGMRRAWFQVSRSGVPHYDLTRNRRADAVRLGAKEATRDDLRRLLANKGGACR